MPRRAQTIDDDDSSQKENIGTPVKVKPAKKKKGNLMRQSRAARSETVTDDEDQPGAEEEAQADEDEEDNIDQLDEDGGDNEEEEQGEGSPNGPKRTRLNTQGESTPTKKERKPQRVTLPRDADGYIPGSITRVQLTNFVTYDWVEFCPGPYLNMILGPNGTGKSSIACALCLGLNFHPSVLGRASDLNSFVKHGCDTGYIEIELKGPKGKPNLVIRRNLNAISNSSTFTLNGKSVAAKEVQNKIAALNIQVGNLCSFLPQDKVSEFAQMTPQQLLKETQRAAGDENLSAWHQTLIRSGKELAFLRETLKGHKDDLQAKEDHIALLERDVRKYEERRKIERQIELLELILPFMEYVEAKRVYNETKERHRALHDTILQLQERNKPAHELKKHLEEQHKQLSKIRETRKKAAQDKFKKMNDKSNQSEKLETDAIELTNKLNDLKKNEKDRLRKIQDIQSKIEQMQHDLDNPPEIEDMTAIEQDMRKLKADSATIKQRQERLQDKQRDNIERVSEQQREVDRFTKQIQDLDSVDLQKLQKLANWDKDCADTIMWLREHKHLFKMQVFEPPCISLAVPNKPYTDAVETCFNAMQLKTFVCQCEEDYKTLNRLVNDTGEALKRKVRIPTWFRPNQESSLSEPPMSAEQLQALGFDGYALDYVECPTGLQWWLKRELQLHRTAISLEGRKVDVKSAMEVVGRAGGANFIAGKSYNMVTRSRYGKKLPQNMIREVKKARNLVSFVVDEEAKSTIERRISEARGLMQEVEKEVTELTQEEREIHDKNAELKAIHAAIMARKKKVTDTQKHLSTLGVKISNARNRLEEFRNAPSVEAERNRLKEQIVGFARKRTAIVKEFTDLVRGAIKDQAEATRVGLEFLQVGANKTALEALCATHDEEHQKARAEYDVVDEEFRQAKVVSKEKLRVSKAKLDEIDDELRDTFQEMETDGRAHAKDSEELQEELDTERAKLELNFATNSDVIEKYEKRKKEIEDLQRVIEGEEKKERRFEKDIQNARENWEPALNTLVTSIGQKFSAAFDRFGCAGEIKITPHEDYDKWAIDILVKFRSTEKLQLLTGQRQSGGERSLTTILYLMSLTEQARAPFSLVDEINQGMDQRAERLVHNQLVEVTCQSDSGQYFLITPKLLPDLRYHERMRILCVNNGEWLPEERDLGNMNSLIDTFIERSKAGKASKAQ